MRRPARLALLLAFSVFASASCTPRPVIVTPADGSYVPTPAGGAGVPVEVDLGPGFGDESSFRVTLLAGLDSPPGTLTDITAAFSEDEGTATGEIDPGLLVPGRSTLFVSISADGDPIAENVVSSSFSWEPELALDTAAYCELLDPGMCLYPFPSDRFTVEDPATDTGRRVAFVREGMPSNSLGQQTDPFEWNRNDGFSPGQALQILVPDVVLQTPGPDPDGPPTPAAGASPEWDTAASLAPDANIVILDSETGERVPHLAERNSRVTDPAGQALLIRPMKNFRSGAHYVVAVRNLRDASGAVIPPNRAFELYRDGIPTYIPEIEERRDHMEAIFDTLASHGVAREDLYLAWDFTVISKRNMSERVIAMRDDAFAKLGADAPNYVINQVEDRPGDPDIRFRVYGQVEVPNYLTNRGESGGPTAATRLYCEDGSGQQRRCEGDELPIQARSYCADAAGVEHPCASGETPASSETYWADFVCTVPSTTLAADGSAVPARPSLYGHGLLGRETEARASHVEDMAFEHNFVFCAARWIGMGDDDQIAVAAILNNFERFYTLSDRLHQAMVNFLFLGRLMIHPDGFGADPVFQDAAGNSIIDGTSLFYDGNSQGAIAGGSLAAVAQDFTRAVLGVPGMNYSTLLFRSKDFNEFLVLLNFAYPDRTIHPVLFGLAQMLWDRVEANGHANHLTSDPYPGTPAKKILLHVAFGDFQVSDLSAQVQARTIGASMHRPGFDPSAYIAQSPTGDPRPFWQVNPFWDIPAIPASDPGPPVPGVVNPTYRFDGSAMIVWDSGNLQSPNTNVPPAAEPPELSVCAANYDGDPHECPRRQPLARIQKSEFLKVDGAVLDVCQGQPCLAPLLP